MASGKFENYQHDRPPTPLRDLHHAMEYDVSGLPSIRTTATSSPSQAGAETAFGEMLVAQVSPVFQLDGLYGLPEREFETYDAAGGTAISTGTLMEVNSGTNTNGYGVIRSRRAVRYRPGQGALARFTAKFSIPQPGTTQRAGFFTQEQALQVGYNGSDFGILRQNGGKAHIHRFEITNPGNGSETVTITLNDYAVACPITSSTVAGTAADIAAGILADPIAPFLWLVEYGPDSVTVLSTSVGPIGGTFGLTSTGTTIATNTIAQAGVAHGDNWIYQTAFNIDTLDGNGPSGMILDHKKLNVYQINFRWLGAGEMRFAIEDPNSGDLVYFHHIHYSNQNTDVHLDNPSLKIGYVAANLSGAPLAQEVKVCGASMLGAIEGAIRQTKYTSAAASANTTNIGQNTLTHVLTIKNRTIFQNKINTREFILKNLNAAFTQSSATPVEVYLVFNHDQISTNLEYTAVNEDTSSVYYSNDQFALAIGNNIPLYVIDVISSVSEDLTDFNINIPPGSTLSILVESTAQITRTGVALTWLED